jgi:hypothetical protein
MICMQTSHNKAVECCQADIRMCLYCLSSVVVTRLEQVVTLLTRLMMVTDLLQVVPT